MSNGGSRTGASPEDAIPRRAVRALLRDEADGALLLLRMQLSGWKGAHWLAPGGGLEAGETDHEGLLREVQEETGLELPTTTPAPLVWTRSVRFEWRGQWYDQQEAYHLIHVPRFTPRLDGNPDPHEIDDVLDAAWWTTEAMRTSRERFIPRAMADAVDALAAGLPGEPIDVGL